MDDDPAYQLVVIRETADLPAAEASILAALRAALARHGVTRADVNIVLVDDRRIAQLNEAHLQHIGPTDVITFDLRDEPVRNGAERPQKIEGEIVLSVETAAREAAQRGHAPESEAALYAVHGVLHLLGYDDADDEQARRMHAEEDEVLAASGLGRIYGGANS